MASYVTHYYFGRSLAGELGEDAKMTVDAHKLSFDIGLQGPDIYFYYFDKQSDNISNRSHNFKIYETFTALADFVRERKDPSIEAYVYGMLCHYALDSVIHPYVYYMQYEVLPKFYSEKFIKALHIIFETNLDYYVSKEFMDSKATAKMCLASDAESRRAVAETHFNVFASVYDTPLDYKKLYNAPKLFRHYQSLFDDGSRFKNGVLTLSARVAGYPSKFLGFIHPNREYTDQDWANKTRRLWNKVRDEDVVVDWDLEQIFAAAKEKALLLIEDFGKAIRECRPPAPELYTITYDGNVAKDTPNGGKFDEEK